MRRAVGNGLLAVAAVAGVGLMAGLVDGGMVETVAVILAAIVAGAVGAWLSDG